MGFELVSYKTAKCFCDGADAWDDLWQRSEVAMPTARAALLTQWLEHFSPDTPFRCLAVRHEGQLVAGLPLVDQRLAGVVHVGSLPQNAWSPGGELLLDPTTDVEHVLDLLVAGLQELPWPILWLNQVELAAPRWQSLIAAFERAGLDIDIHPRFEIGWVDTTGGWPEYTKGRSKNFRRQMRRGLKRAREEGELELRVHDRDSPQDLDVLLGRAFDVENSSWKGDNQSSILQTPGMFDFFTRQAHTLAHLGHLQLTFLERDNRTIAFEYGMAAKGIYHSFKVSYDERFSACSPGRLLLYMILERMFEAQPWRGADFMGPVDPSTSSFVTSTNTYGRIAVAPRLGVGTALLGVYKSCWPAIRRLRGQRKGGCENSLSTPSENPSLACSER